MVGTETEAKDKSTVTVLFISLLDREAHTCEFVFVKHLLSSSSMNGILVVVVVVVVDVVDRVGVVIVVDFVDVEAVIWGTEELVVVVVLLVVVLVPGDRNWSG